VIGGEVVCLAYHFLWMACVVPWVLLWPSVVLVGAGILGEGDFRSIVAANILAPTTDVIRIWAMAALLHTATYLASTPYERFTTRYQRSQEAGIAEALRRERIRDHWRRS